MQQILNARPLGAALHFDNRLPLREAARMAEEKPFKAVGDFLKRKREAAPLSLSELAAKAGLPTRHYASYLESGVKDPRSSMHFKSLIAALGITPQELYELMTGDRLPRSVNPSFREGDPLVEAARLTGKVAVPVYPAGAGLEALTELAVDGVLVTQPKETDARLVAIRVKDRTMAPYLEPGDLAIVALDPRLALQPGSRALVLSDGVLAIRAVLGSGQDDGVALRADDASGFEVVRPEALLGSVLMRLKAN